MVTGLPAGCFGLVWLLVAVPAPAPRGDESSQTFLEGVVREVGVPKGKPFDDQSPPPAEPPAFSSRVLQAYARSGGASRLRSGVRKARALLWAITPGQQAPADLAPDVKALQKALKGNQLVLRDGVRAPAHENPFKAMIFQEERKLAVVLMRLEEELEELKTAGRDRDKEPARWRANYDLTRAYLHRQIALSYEYQSMLGALRQEFPPRDPVRHGGWKLVARPQLRGDLAGKKMAAEAHKLLDQVIKDHPGTPWEQLARRARAVPLGLEWQAAR